MSGRELASQKGRRQRRNEGWASVGDVSGAFGHPTPCLSDTWDVQEGAQFGISALKALWGGSLEALVSPLSVLLTVAPSRCGGDTRKEAHLGNESRGRIVSSWSGKCKDPQPSPSSSPEQKDTAPLTCPLPPMGKQCPQEPGPWGLLPLQHLGVRHVAGTQRPGGRTELTQSERGF